MKIYVVCAYEIDLLGGEITGTHFVGAYTDVDRVMKLVHPPAWKPGEHMDLGNDQWCQDFHCEDQVTVYTIYHVDLNEGPQRRKS